MFRRRRFFNNVPKGFPGRRRNLAVGAPSSRRGSAVMGIKFFLNGWCGRSGNVHGDDVFEHNSHNPIVVKANLGELGEDLPVDDNAFVFVGPNAYSDTRQ